MTSIDDVIRLLEAAKGTSTKDVKPLVNNIQDQKREKYLLIRRSIALLSRN